MGHTTKPMIIIYGSTGVGKSELALKLADTIPASIINADMGQLYTPLSIGTAKPDIAREKTPHYLFNMLDEPRNYSNADYRESASQAIERVQAEGKFPLVVGGSGFYLHSLFFTQDEASGTVTDETDFTHVSTNELWQMLAGVDPARADMIHKNDRYRIVRALHIWRTTGMLPSGRQQAYAPVSPYILIWVERERDELYERINTRVADMIDTGWVNEARALKDTEWEPFLRKKKIIGYDVLFDYIDGLIDRDQAIALIAQKTRNYAKRQITFWHMLEKKLGMHALEQAIPAGSIDVINLTLSDLDLYIKQLSEQLARY